MLRCNAKHMKYLLVDEGFFSLNSGGASFDLSLFTDTELNTSEPDLSLRTQRAKRERETLAVSEIAHSFTHSLIPI